MLALWLRRLAVFVLGLGLSAPLLAQDAPARPAGWVKRSRPNSEAVIYAPKDLPAGALLEVHFGERGLLEGLPLEDWMESALVAQQIPECTWTAPLVVSKQTPNLAMAQSQGRHSSGAEVALVAAGVSVDGLNGRYGLLVFTAGKATERYQAEAQGLLMALFDFEKKAAQEDGRGLDLEVPPPQVEGLKSGGELRPGRYVGNLVSSWDNKVLRPVEVVLFANGEYEFLRGMDEYDSTGQYSYSPATGRLNLTDEFYNSTYNPTEDFCVYGFEASKKGKAATPVIYAENDRGTSVHSARLRWSGTSDRLAPSLAAEVKAAAEAEAERYKHVTAPGKGVQLDEIETVLYTFEQRFDIGGMQIEEWVYLLLKDGRVMDGLPVPPQDLDLAASRSREPDRWGWWQREDGQYRFAWPARPQRYEPPRGAQLTARSSTAGMRVSGTFESASSYAIPGGASSVQFWGVTLSPKGRFQKYRHGMTSAGGVPGLDVMVSTVWDDEGATTAVSGPNIGGGVTSKSRAALAGRIGHYEFDGYALLLTYDDGRKARLPSFWLGEGQSQLWFEGASLGLKKP